MDRPPPDLATPLQEFLVAGHRSVIPHLSVDCAVFGFDGEALRVLLLRFQGVERWGLAGGHVGWDESLDDAAARVLRERTGLEHVFLEQFHAFGARDRGLGAMRSVLAAAGVELPPGHWLAERHVSVGYLALVRFTEARPTRGPFTAEWRWWDVRGRPPMMFDHDAIVARALTSLRARARAYELGGALLPEKFTMAELQRLYEAVLGRALDRRNFRAKVLELGVLEELPERKTGPHRASILYRFRPEATAIGDAVGAAASVEEDAA
jgi:8-oxo-dGTP diphosphatase